MQLISDLEMCYFSKGVEMKAKKRGWGKNRRCGRGNSNDRQLLLEGKRRNGAVAGGEYSIKEDFLRRLKFGACLDSIERRKLVLDSRTR